MTDKNLTEQTNTEKESKKSSTELSRRELVAAVVGATGMASIATACEGNDTTGVAALEVNQFQSALQTTSDPHWFDTLSAMSDASGGANPVIGVLAGYWSSDDGGGGLFYWDPDEPVSSDNGGTIFSGDDGGTGYGCWKRIYSGPVNVRWFGATPDETDNHDAIQAAVNYAVVLRQIVYFPAGEYTVKQTINLPIGSQLKGETGYQSAKSYGVDPGATTIYFEPTTEQSLFVASGTGYGPHSARFFYSIDGFYLCGNSETQTGNSKFALDLDEVGHSRFENLGIEKFRYGVRCFRTIDNRLVNIMASGTIAAVLYDGGNATTDVWDHCYIGNSPIGVQTNGTSLSVRFVHCLFEQIDLYGINLVKESDGFSFTDCYSENVPCTTGSTGAMFRVGHDGSTLPVGVHLSVSGGYYGGILGGAEGSWLDIDASDGVCVSSPTVTRYTNVIKCTDNTRDKSIVVSGLQGTSFTYFKTGPDEKLQGFYPSSVLNAATGYCQHAEFGRVTTPIIQKNRSGTGTVTANCQHMAVCDSGGAFYPRVDNQVNMGTAALRWNKVHAERVISTYLQRNEAGTGTVTANCQHMGVCDTNGAFYPRVDNSVALGTSNLRWQIIYAANGVINTSDEREKEDILPISDKLLDAWSDVEFYQFRWKKEPEKIQVGVIVQRIIQTFEKHGLNALDYGLISFEDDRFGIRADQCLFLETAALRRELQRVRGVK